MWWQEEGDYRLYDGVQVSTVMLLTKAECTRRGLVRMVVVGSAVSWSVGRVVWERLVGWLAGWEWVSRSGDG